MSSDEIDRVLNNIRRLVSVEGDQKSSGGDRLVLTSDLRVGNGAPQAQPKAEPYTAADDTFIEMAQADSDADGAKNDLPPILEVVTDPATSRSLEERIAGLEAAIGRGEEFEPDGSEAQDQHRPDKVPNLRSDIMHEVVDEPDNDAQSQDSAADVPDNQDETLDPPMGDPMMAFDRHDRVHAPHPEGPTEPRFTHAEDDPTPEMQFSHRSDPLTLEDPEEVLDEEALRDLIAEIVREELAGTLGERITRNVRKLVRREIMRILSARDFE